VSELLVVVDAAGKGMDKRWRVESGEWRRPFGVDVLVGARSRVHDNSRLEARP
jgi:hypothetical protein